jgi:hypothetical protein
MKFARLTAIAFLMLVALPAAAKKGSVQKMAVLPIILKPTATDVTITSIYGDIVDASSLRIGLRIITNEEMFAMSTNLSGRVQDCGSDVACIAQKLRASDAPLGMVVVVNNVLNPPLIGLQLIDTDQGVLIGQSLGGLEKDAPTISETVRRRARKLLEAAGFTQAGRVVVDVNPTAAKVVLGEDFEPDAGTPNIFTVPPGAYPVRAVLDGYDGAQGQVVALAGRESRVALVLDKQSSVTSSPWFWSLIGAAVVGGGVTAAAIALRSTDRCLCLELVDSSGKQIPSTCGCPK